MTDAEETSPGTVRSREERLPDGTRQAIDVAKAVGGGKGFVTAGRFAGYGILAAAAAVMVLAIYASATS